MIGIVGAGRSAAASGGCLLAISSYAATSLNDPVVQVAALRIGQQVTDAVVIDQGIATAPAFLQQLRGLDRAAAGEREQWLQEQATEGLMHLKPRNAPPSDGLDFPILRLSQRKSITAVGGWHYSFYHESGAPTALAFHFEAAELKNELREPLRRAESQTLNRMLLGLKLMLGGAGDAPLLSISRACAAALQVETHLLLDAELGLGPLAILDHGVKVQESLDLLWKFLIELRSKEALGMNPVSHYQRGFPTVRSSLAAAGFYGF